MKDILKYKDFIGSIHFNNDDEVFFGKIEGINDLVTFEGTTVSGIKKAFHEAVNDYIEICEKTGKEIFKSFKGSFNIRISPDLHKKAFRKALVLGLSLNQFVKKAIEHEVLEKK